MIENAISPSPLLSIGMPVRNGENYLDQALRSILNQDFKDLELIVADNASEDGTCEICRAHAAADGRVRLVRHSQNVGAAENFNQTFRLARGRYFKWAAHDDVLGPGMLAAAVLALEQDARVALAYPRNVSLIDEHGEVIGREIEQMDSVSPDPVARFGAWMRARSAICTPVFGVARREVMATTNLHGVFAGADRVFVAEMALRGGITSLSDVTFCYRVHPGMSTRANRGLSALSEWYTGKAKHGLPFTKFAVTRGYAGAIRKSDLTDGNRKRALLVLAGFTVRNAPTALAREAKLALGVTASRTALGQRLRTSPWIRAMWGDRRS